MNERKGERKSKGRNRVVGATVQPRCGEAGRKQIARLRKNRRGQREVGQCVQALVLSLP